MAIVIGVIVGLALAFLINAGLVWVIVWALKGIGITAIGGWTVAFSWPLVILFTVIMIIVNSFFLKIKG